MQMPQAAPFDPASAGWEPVGNADYVLLVGPFWRRRDGAAPRFGLLAEPRHGNNHGVVHGGMIVSFADEAFGMAVKEAAGGQPCMTAQLNAQFVGPVRIGDFVETCPEVLRVSRSLVFIRGVLAVGDRVVAHLDGVWKILGAR